MPHDVIATCPVCPGTRRDPAALPELRDQPGGRLQRRALRAPQPRADRPARELPPLPRQPARDGTRARHQLPDRARSGGGVGAGARFGPRADADEDTSTEPSPHQPATPSSSGWRATRSVRRRRRRPSAPWGGPTDDHRHDGRHEHEIGADGLLVLTLADGDLRLRAAGGGEVRVRARDAARSTAWPWSAGRGASRWAGGAASGLVSFGRTPDLDIDLPAARTSSWRSRARTSSSTV